MIDMTWHNGCVICSDLRNYIYIHFCRCGIRCKYWIINIKNKMISFFFLTCQKYTEDINNFTWRTCRNVFSISFLFYSFMPTHFLSYFHLPVFSSNHIPFPWFSLSHFSMFIIIQRLFHRYIYISNSARFFSSPPPPHLCKHVCRRQFFFIKKVYHSSSISYFLTQNVL